MADDELKNPYWVAWERAGSPKPTAEFPNAGAFILWIQERWREFEDAKGWKLQPPKYSHGVIEQTEYEQRSWFRMTHADEFKTWLLAKFPEVKP